MSINWPGIDRQSLSGRLLRLPLRFIPNELTVTIRRGPGKGLKWIAGSCNHGCWLGTFELEKQNALARVIERGMTIYDVGANVGFYTLFFSVLVGSQGSVYAFEPAFEAVSYLTRHVRVNHLQNVRIIQAALGGRDGLIGFTTDQRSENHCTDSRPNLLVPILKMDQLGLPAPDIVKIDIEGSESEALEGAKEMLIKHRPILFIALHGAQVARECRDFLNRIGYPIHGLRGEILPTESLPDEICATATPHGFSGRCGI